MTAAAVPTELARRVDAQLIHDPGRVVAQLFLPGEELVGGTSRSEAVVQRVLALAEPEVERAAAELIAEFADRHHDYPSLLAQHAASVGSHVYPGWVMSPARSVVMGAVFTAEFAVEGAALCNPSAVLHPDQSGLEPGQARVAVSLRAIGEGHISSIEFCTAVIGPGPQWVFQPRRSPLFRGEATETSWRSEHLRAVMADADQIDGLAHNVLGRLPETFTGSMLRKALDAAPHDLLTRAGAICTVELFRRLMASAYEVAFPADLDLSQRVLLPNAEEERQGMEDARFVRFVEDDGTIEYRATYTAYDGQQIAPRLLTSPDLRTFRAHRLAGPAARNKGMALFPRMIDGRHLALCRTDGETTSLTRSVDSVLWDHPEPIHIPVELWQVLQVGNCGAPIETERGWLVLTHGVGPMRVYSMGAMLLDLNNPTKVIGRMTVPLLKPLPEESEGYVPHVVYSCGGVVHDGLLWIPYGIGDARVGVAWVNLDELLDTMIKA